MLKRAPRVLTYASWHEYYEFVCIEYRNSEACSIPVSVPKR